MTGVVGHKGSRGVELVVGVDTHQDEHVAVAIDRQGVRLGELTMTASTPRLPSPPCAVSIPSLLPQARPTGIGSTEAATARPTRHSIALLSSDFVMMSGPRHTCVVAPPRE